MPDDVRRLMNEQVGSAGEDYYFGNALATTGQEIKLTSKMRNVYITMTDASTATFYVLLPPVAEMKGQFLFIRAIDIAGGGTIYDAGYTGTDESYEWTDLAMNADGKYCLLYSTGKQWVVVKTDM
jgi:hypothetical protein